MASLPFNDILAALKNAPENVYPSEYILQVFDDSLPSRDVFISFINTNKKTLLESLKSIPFRAAIKGGFALAYLGLPTDTADIDLTALEPFTEESVKRLMTSLESSFPLIESTPPPELDELEYIASPPIVKGNIAVVHRKKLGLFEKVEVILRIGEYQDTIIDYSADDSYRTLSPAFLEPIGEYLSVFHRRILSFQHKIVFRNRLSILRSKMLEYDNTVLNLLMKPTDDLISQEVVRRNLIFQNKFKIYGYIVKLLALGARLDVYEQGEGAIQKSLLQILIEYSYSSQVYRNMVDFLLRQQSFKTQYAMYYQLIVNDFMQIIRRPVLIDTSGVYKRENYEKLSLKLAEIESKRVTPVAPTPEPEPESEAEPEKESLENILKNVEEIDSIVTGKSFYDQNAEKRMNIIKNSSNQQLLKENAIRKQKERERETKQKAKLKKREKELKEVEKSAAAEKEGEELLEKILEERVTNYDAKLVMLLFEPILTDPESHFILEVETILEDEGIPKNPSYFYTSSLIPYELTIPIKSSVDSQDSLIPIVIFYFYCLYNFCVNMSDYPLAVNKYIHAVGPLHGFVQSNILKHKEIRKHVALNKALIEMSIHIENEFAAIMKIQEAFKVIVTRRKEKKDDIARFKRNVRIHIIKYLDLFKLCLTLLLKIMFSSKNPKNILQFDMTKHVDSLFDYLSSDACIHYLEEKPFIKIDMTVNKILERIKHLFIKVYQLYVMRQIYKIPDNKIPIILSTYPSDLKISFDRPMDEFLKEYGDIGSSYLVKPSITNVNFEKIFSAANEKNRKLYDLNLAIINKMKEGELFPPSILDSEDKTLHDLVYEEIVLAMKKNGYSFPRKAYKATREFLSLLNTSWKTIFMKSIQNELAPDPIYLDIMLRTSDHVWRKDELRSSRFIEFIYKLWLYSQNILNCFVLVNNIQHWSQIYQFLIQKELDDEPVENVMRAWFVTNSEIIGNALTVHFNMSRTNIGGGGGEGGGEGDGEGGSDKIKSRKAYRKTMKYRK